MNILKTQVPFYEQDLSFYYFLGYSVKSVIKININPISFGKSKLQTLSRLQVIIQ